MTTGNSRRATVQSGVYCAKGGYGRLAQRDVFERLHLTPKGVAAYRQAVTRYEQTLDEEQLRRDVAGAVSAGY